MKKATGLGNVANRLANSKNPYQRDIKKVLCVCSAGLLRSPTAAVVLSQDPWNFNTRAAGIEKEWALIPIDEVLVWWADEFVCMTLEQYNFLKGMTDKPIHCLDIADSYEYRNPILVRIMKEKFENIW